MTCRYLHRPSVPPAPASAGPAPCTHMSARRCRSAGVSRPPPAAAVDAWPPTSPGRLDPPRRALGGRARAVGPTALASSPSSARDSLPATGASGRAPVLRSLARQRSDHARVAVSPHCVAVGNDGMRLAGRGGIASLSSADCRPYIASASSFLTSHRVGDLSPTSFHQTRINTGRDALLLMK